MAYFDQLDKCEFGGIAFPVERLQISCGLRRHLHEYPHTPAAATEKQGRRNYTFRLASTFDEAWNRRYPKLYPDGLEKLFKMWEEETTSGLFVPTLGKVDCYCVNWAKDMNAELRSGEHVELEFEEDQSQLYVIDALLATSAGALESLNLDFQQALTASELGLPLPDIFEKINDAITRVMAVRDQAEIGSQLLESKLLQVADLCGQADRDVKALQDPINHQVLDALKEVWASAANAAQDIAGKANPIRTYVTPKRMTIADVSNAIYGVTSRGLEILQLNEVEDAFSIPAQTGLRYYDSAA